MKALKNKIILELNKMELSATKSEKEIDKTTLDTVYKLSKTLFYLDKAEQIAGGGVYEFKGMAKM